MQIFETLCALLSPAHRSTGVVVSAPDAVETRERILPLAAIHCVRPHLLRALRHGGGARDSAELLASDEFFRWHAIHCMKHVSALTDVCNRMAAANIAFAVFKGPVLAWQLYGGIAEREFGDLDVIVQSADRGRVMHVLESCGFRPEMLDRSQQHAFFDHLNQESFRNDETGVALDLHWQFAPRGIPFPVDTAQALGRRDFISIGGTDIPVLCAVDCALFLAGHGMKDAWMSLDWCADFCAFVARHENLDWKDLYKRSCDRQCGLQLAVAFEISRNLFSVPVNMPFEISPEHERRAHRLAARYIADLKSKDGSRRGLDSWAGLDMCETAAQRLRYLASLAFNRSKSDLESMPLPAWLWPLYRITRPLRLIGGRMFSRQIRRGRT